MAHTLSLPCFNTCNWGERDGGFGSFHQTIKAKKKIRLFSLSIETSTAQIPVWGGGGEGKSYSLQTLNKEHCTGQDVEHAPRTTHELSN